MLHFLKNFFSFFLTAEISAKTKNLFKRLKLVFFCCRCRGKVEATLECMTNHQAWEHGIRIPCPDCQEINLVKFNQDGYVLNCRGESRYEPSTN